MISTQKSKVQIAKDATIIKEISPEYSTRLQDPDTCFAADNIGRHLSSTATELESGLASDINSLL